MIYSCATHLNALGRGETKFIQCSTPKSGRYVVVNLRITEYLTLCEVEVYAIRGGKEQFPFHP